MPWKFQSTQLAITKTTSVNLSITLVLPMATLFANCAVRILLAENQARRNARSVTCSELFIGFKLTYVNGYVHKNNYIRCNLLNNRHFSHKMLLKLFKSASEATERPKRPEEASRSTQKASQRTPQCSKENLKRFPNSLKKHACFNFARWTADMRFKICLALENDKLWASNFHHRKRFQCLGGTRKALRITRFC